MNSGCLPACYLGGDGETQLLLFTRDYNDERVGSARKSFERAARHGATRGAAQSWIDHLNEEASSG